MVTIHDKAEMSAYAAENNGRLGFVPTMGFLHEGHMSLVRRAKAENEKVVVSIFINPAQFSDPEDLLKYPIDIERDTRLLTREGVDVLFLPARQEVYPRGVPQLRLTYPNLMNKLCGIFRPGHFEGVLLIVHNLFQWVRPARAYFGLKDYQQYVLIKAMARDLEMPVDVIGCPLVREDDGLAMSSRNVRLDSGAHQAALNISAALGAISELAHHRVKSPVDLQLELIARLEPLKVEYAEICHAETLETLAVWPQQPEAGSILIAVAAWAGGVRLIDNCII